MTTITIFLPQPPRRGLLFSGHDLLHECLEPRIAAQIVQQRTYFDNEQVVCLTVAVATVQFVNGMLLVT